jgi:protein-S-isoprenylcysteine O-methyltransferase Ste14
MLKKFKGSLSDIILVLVLGYLAYVYHRKFDRLDYFGASLIIISITTWLIARYQLGDAFSIFPQSKTIVSKGLYSKIRHPIYLSSIIASLGLCLMYKETWAYFVWLLLIILQALRAKKEEEILTRRFPEKYQAYKKSTWF